MYDDEERAREQLKDMNDIITDCKKKIRLYHLPLIHDNYFVIMDEAIEAIGEVSKELENKPIVIKTLNIRVDTARDLVFKIYNKTNDLIKSVLFSERLIVYGNRYRSSYQNIDQTLNEATELFNKGQYKKSLDLLIKELTKIDTSVLEKLKIEI